jgi:polysaccharide chain length determinant protein (PEP-CTERM system associated)
MANNRRATDGTMPAPARFAPGDYRDLLRRRWKYPALIFPTSILIATFIAFYIPVSYRASGTIMLLPSSIPTDMVSSTVRRLEDVPYSTAQQELELVREKVMTADKLRELVRELDPYPGQPNLGLEAKAERVAENTSVERVDPITLKPLDESTAFSVYYDNPHPKIAAAVAAKLVNLYLTYNRETRTEQAAAAYEFLQSQAKTLEASMIEEEQKLAQFKGNYGNSLPEMRAHNLSEIDRAQHDLDEAQREILVAEEKESQLQLQLNGLSPSMTAAVSDWRAQLAKLRSDLAEAELKYTPAHPEVKRLRRAIDEMTSKGAASLQTGAQAPDNPEYLAVKSQLDGVRRSLATLRAGEGHARNAIATYEKGLSTEPNVEREFTQLQREYDNSRSRYEDVQTKMKNAALARSMEAQDRGERFALLHAPTPPKRPFYPNRLGIILLGVVLGLGLAFGCVTIVDATDPTVRGTADLQELTGAAALGVVPTLLNPIDVRERRLRWGAAIAVFAIASLGVAFTVILKR